LKNLSSKIPRRSRRAIALTKRLAWLFPATFVVLAAARAEAIIPPVPLGCTYPASNADAIWIVNGPPNASVNLAAGQPFRPIAGQAATLTTGDLYAVALSDRVVISASNVFVYDDVHLDLSTNASAGVHVRVKARNAVVLYGGVFLPPSGTLLLKGGSIDQCRFYLGNGAVVTGGNLALEATTAAGIGYSSTPEPELAFENVASFAMRSAGSVRLITRNYNGYLELGTIAGISGIVLTGPNTSLDFRNSLGFINTRGLPFHTPGVTSVQTQP
jgi:hypothetical protein